MTFWLLVFVAYALLLAVGVKVGLWLSAKYPPKPSGGRGPVPIPDDSPGGISVVPDFVPAAWVREYSREDAS